jgi:hypothetical protein
MPIKIEVCNHANNGNHGYLGEVTISVNEMLEA